MSHLFSQPPPPREIATFRRRVTPRPATRPAQSRTVPQSQLHPEAVWDPTLMAKHLAFPVVERVGPPSSRTQHRERAWTAGRPRHRPSLISRRSTATRRMRAPTSKVRRLADAPRTFWSRPGGPGGSVEDEWEYVSGSWVGEVFRVFGGCKLQLVPCLGAQARQASKDV